MCCAMLLLLESLPCAALPVMPDADDHRTASTSLPNPDQPAPMDIDDDASDPSLLPTQPGIPAHPLPPASPDIPYGPALSATPDVDNHQLRETAHRMLRRAFLCLGNGTTFGAGLAD